MPVPDRRLQSAHGKTDKQRVNHEDPMTLDGRFLLWISLLLCPVAGGALAGEQGRPPLQVFDLAGAGLDGANLCMVQSDEGPIFVGNDHGVLEFDGVDWRRTPLPGASQARSLLAGGDGRLYYGGNGEFGWFETLSGGGLRAVALSDSLPAEQRAFLDIRAIHQLDHGIYFRSQRFLARWTGERLQIWDPAEEIQGSAQIGDTLYLQLDPQQGAPWRHLDPARLNSAGRELPAEAVIVRPDPGLFDGGNRLLFYLPWGEGRLFGTRRAGLFREGADGRGQALHAGTNARLAALDLFDGCPLPGGGAALATLQGGLLLVDEAGCVQRVIEEKDGLRGSTAISVALDRQHALWATLYGGLARIDLAQPFTLFDAADGLPGRPLSLVRHHGRLHVGTTAGLFRLQPGDDGTHPPRPPAFEPVAGLKGIVWELLSADGSLFAILGGQLVELDARDSLIVHFHKQPSSLLRSEHDPDRIYAYVNGSLELLRREGGRWRAAGSVPGLVGLARSLAEDPDGALWVGTGSHGLFRVAPAGRGWSLSQFGPGQGLPSGKSVVFRLDQRLHASIGGRIFVWDARVGRLLPDSYIGAVGLDPLREEALILEDADGLIWALLESGPALGRRGVDGVIRWDFTSLRTLGASLGTLLPEGDGVAWFGSPSGLLRLDLAARHPDPPRERVLLRELRLGDKLLHEGRGPLPWGEHAPLKLAAKGSELEIAASLPSMAFTDLNRYSLRLVGRDRDWSPWSPVSRWRIGALEPGRYTLRVRALDARDRLAEEIVLPIRVPVPWTSSWWFRGLLLAVVGLAVHVAATIRSRRLTRSNLALQREVEERRRAELARRQSEARYRSLIEQSIDATCVSRPGRLNYINESFRRLFEIGSLDVTEPGFDPMILVAPESQEALRQVEEAVLRGDPVPMPFEFEGRTLSGRMLRIEATMARIPTQDGFVSQAIMRDITERRQLEEQLRQSQKMEAVGRLAGGVAHDFNNILLVIIGQCDMMSMSLDSEDPLREEIEQVQDAAQRAARLTRQLLAFSRKQTLHPQQISINTVLADLEKMLRRLISEDIEIRLRLAPDLRRVSVDPGQLDQVLVNLVVNARDAMPEGGALTIQTRNVELDEERAREIGGLQPGSHVQLSVEDTGTGIEAGVLEHIFEPFFTTKAEGQGTGLGLATVYGIVTQSGGAIEVESEPGRGTRFIIWLPASQQGETEAGSRAGLPVDLTGSERVLVVEDEDAVRSVILRTLEGHGYSVVEARDGLEALDRLAHENGRIDIVLTDMVMPRMGGHELIEEIRRRRPQLPLLVMTGYTDRELDQRQLESRSVGILTKPFGPAALLGALRRRLGSALVR
jgi:two-component system, cell cycle sensor histidine kinase and response regulator CckA